MRASREKFAESRERILAVAAKLFREKGFDGIGLADIMKAAGLTHGGFYRHFASKDDLEAQATGVALATTTTDWSRLVEGAAAQPLAEFVGQYLSAEHRDDPGNGCALAMSGHVTAPPRSMMNSRRRRIRPRWKALRAISIL